MSIYDTIEHPGNAVLCELEDDATDSTVEFRHVMDLLYGIILTDYFDEEEHATSDILKSNMFKHLSTLIRQAAQHSTDARDREIPPPNTKPRAQEVISNVYDVDRTSTVLDNCELTDTHFKELLAALCHPNDIDVVQYNEATFMFGPCMFTMGRLWNEIPEMNATLTNILYIQFLRAEAVPLFDILGTEVKKDPIRWVNTYTRVAVLVDAALKYMGYVKWIGWARDVMQLVATCQMVTTLYRGSDIKRLKMSITPCYLKLKHDITKLNIKYASRRINGG